MEYISSDTNIWLDFENIDRLDLPFKLPYIYLMDGDAVEDELLNPPGIADKLIKMGLQKTELTAEEFFAAEEFVNRYAKLSLYDCIALAIAKIRNLTLLTGDGPLRKAAKVEDVRLIGTIGILDRLLEGQYIDSGEFQYCIKELLKRNGGRVRLPESELRKRLQMKKGE